MLEGEQIHQSTSWLNYPFPIGSIAGHLYKASLSEMRHRIGWGLDERISHFFSALSQTIPFFGQSAFLEEATHRTFLVNIQKMECYKIIDEFNQTQGEDSSRRHICRRKLTKLFCKSVLLQDEKEILLEIIKQGEPHHILFASRRLQKDREILLAALKYDLNGNLLNFKEFLSFFPENFEYDKEILYSVLRTGMNGLKFFYKIPQEYFKDKECLRAIFYVPKGYLSDKSFDDYDNKESNVGIISKKIKEVNCEHYFDDVEFLLELIEYHHHAYDLASDKLKNNFLFNLKAKYRNQKIMIPTKMLFEKSQKPYFDDPNNMYEYLFIDFIDYEHTYVELFFKNVGYNIDVEKEIPEEDFQLLDKIVDNDPSWLGYERRRFKTPQTFNFFKKIFTPMGSEVGLKSRRVIREILQYSAPDVLKNIDAYFFDKTVQHFVGFSSHCDINIKFL